MKKLKAFFPIVFTLCLFIFYYFKRITAVKFYPPTMDFLIFLLFFGSLFQKETIIQKTAKLMNPNLSEPEIIYTKNLTYIWCAFLFINFLIALYTVFLSDKVWFLYNGIISYFLIGTIFIIEYIIRIIFRKKHNL